MNQQCANTCSTRPCTHEMLQSQRLRVIPENTPTSPKSLVGHNENGEKTSNDITE